MLKILFVPVSVVSGLVSGFLAKKIFEQIWNMVEDQDPPEPEHHDTTWPKLMASLLIRGAVFQLTRGAVERFARERFYGVTGAWPGEARPDVD